MSTEQATVERPVTVRRAERRDLTVLVALESGFPGDRMSKVSLARLLSRESAEVLVAEVATESGTEVVGDVVLLFRRGYKSARLYSMIVKSQWRGRGVARALLNAAEDLAQERGSVSIRLEVREDNPAAIALYRNAGYEVGGRTSDYYEDHSTALRMRKRFRQGGATVLGVPYYAQSLEFTCGPASLMMAMRYHGYPVPLERWLELALWREATTVFMLAGHGGCSAHGLAAAALRRGFKTTVVTRDASVPFLDSVRDPEKKEVVRIAHETFEREIRALGGRQELRDFGADDVVAAIKQGAVPLALVSGYRFHESRMPHWVVITGFDDEHLYLHDPIVPDDGGRAESVNLAVTRKEFDAVSRYGRAQHRSLVLIERWGMVNRRRQGDV
ncbi:MAG TPA: GNAT family N-acetyltransferase/peptidase C39 family protein [Trueperaceae bacterium]|nr:GNAT family N-acetyltransferase/peptidase C39 family protein [Trueperaceae bacterium]